jgi:hypothetical protein
VKNKMISIPKSAGVTAVSQIVNCTKTSAAPVILKKHLYKRNVFLPTKKHTLPSSGIAAFVEIGGKFWEFLIISMSYCKTVIY